MGIDSKIQWTHHTFNPWIGCSKISPGCKHCYADALVTARPALVLGTGVPRVQEEHRLPLWGEHGPRRVTSRSYWREPLKWNRAAQAAGERRRVFCASLADVFEANREVTGDTGCVEPDLDGVREALWDLIEQTPHLDWLLLTKRPHHVLDMVPMTWAVKAPGSDISGRFPPNVWVGTTAEDQERLDERWPILSQIPASVLFLSLEPALGPMLLPGSFLARGRSVWAIWGGESGHGARACAVEWGESIVAQCYPRGVPVFIKQTGAVTTMEEDRWLRLAPTPLLSARSKGRGGPGGVAIAMAHPKGGDFDEIRRRFPDLAVREFPSGVRP